MENVDVFVKDGTGRVRWVSLQALLGLGPLPPADEKHASDESTKTDHGNEEADGPPEKKLCAAEEVVV